MSKINKKNLWLAFLLTLSATCIFSACNKNDGNSESVPNFNSSISSVEEKEELHLERTALSVLVYEDITLAIEGNYPAEDLVWKSSDESIATVENGRVMTKKPGVVNITVSYGELSDTCVLTVEDTTVVPVLKFNVDNSTVSLNKTFQYGLEITLTYNAKEYTDLVCSYESENPEIATVTADGLITAVGEGTTKITVTTQWRGTEVVGQVDVCVVDTAYISLDTKNVEMYAVSPQGYDLPTSVAITPTFNKGDSIVENIEFTIEELVDDGEAGKVASISNNTLTAVGVGSAKFVVTCEYEGKTYYSETIIVTVNSVIINLTDDLYATKSSQDLYVELKDVIACEKVDSAIVNGEEVNVRNKTQLQIAPLENGVYEVSFFVDGVDSIEYKTQLLVADKLISTVSDLNKLDANGYYVVTKDIDCKGAEVNHLFTADNWYAAERFDNGFQGVFDGNGHTISNISVDSCGFFGNIGSQAVVKNLGLYNVTTRNSGYGWAMGLAMYVWGTVENVSYYQAAGDTLLNSVVGAVNGANISNFVVYAPNVSISGFFNSLPARGNCKNIYIISNKANTNSLNYCSWFSSETYATDNNFTSIDFTKIFDLSEDGFWLMHRELNIPLIRNVVSIEDELKVINTNEDLTIENSYFDEIISVSIDGVQLSENDYSVDGTILTIKSEYLATIEKLDYDICDLVVKTNYAVYSTELSKQRGEVTGETQEYIGGDLSFVDDSFANVKSVKVNGTSLDEGAYSVNGTVLTLKKEYLNTLTNWNNTFIVETPTVQYKASIEIYTYINSLDDLQALTGLKGNPNAYYKLTTDLDAKDYGKTFGRFFNANWWTALAGDDATVFQGVFDGQGHTISNIKVSEFGFFGTIGVNGVVKNVGFYNVNSTGTHATIDFGIATDLYGTLENVSYYQDGASDICAIVGRIQTSSKVNNFIGYVGNAKTCGFVNTNSSANVKNFTNVYVISNVFNNNSIAFSTEFAVDTYKTNEDFLAIDFSKIFDCSATGIWKMDEVLGLPLI